MSKLESGLPEFIVVAIRKPHADVECPRCHEQFTINGAHWRRPLYSTLKPDVEIKGRSCPYCFRTALVPAQFFPKKVRSTK